MTKLIGSQTQRIFWHCALLIALLVPLSALADSWQLQAGAESPDRGRQALAFLRMKSGSIPATAYVGPFRRTSDTR